MTIQSVKYHNDTRSIVELLLDGVPTYAPINAGGSIGRLIDEWVQNGNSIEPYVAPPPTANDVNAERQRRIAAGTVISGVYITGRDEDARNLQALVTGAQLRLASGDTTTLTVFRDGNNVDHELTPSQIVGLFVGSTSYVSALYAASWALKAMDPIPQDYADDDYWL